MSHHLHDDAVFEAEGLLEDPEGEIDAPLAGRGRRFFTANARVDPLAGRLLQETRASFAYTVEPARGWPVRQSHETPEPLRLVLFLDGSSMFDACKVMQPILAYAAAESGVDEVGVFDIRDDTLLLVVHLHSSSEALTTEWSEQEFERAKSRLRKIVSSEELDR